MSDFMNNPFISQKKKDIIAEAKKNVKDRLIICAAGLSGGQSLEAQLTEIINSIFDQIPEILETWTQEDYE